MQKVPFFLFACTIKQHKGRAVMLFTGAGSINFNIPFCPKEKFKEIKD